VWGREGGGRKEGEKEEMGENGGKEEMEGKI